MPHPGGVGFYVAFIIDVYSQGIVAWHAQTAKNFELVMIPLQLGCGNAADRATQHLVVVVVGWFVLSRQRIGRCVRRGMINQFEANLAA